MSDTTVMYGHLNMKKKHCKIPSMGAYQCRYKKKLQNKCATMKNVEHLG